MKTKVKFRQFPDQDDVIALFPNEAYSNDPDLIMSYQHIGQHGAASKSLINDLPLASFHDYKPLYIELKSIGYELEVL